MQTCVIHLIRASPRFCSWKDPKTITKKLRPIYTATTFEAAEDAMDTFELEWEPSLELDAEARAARQAMMAAAMAPPGAGV